MRNLIFLTLTSFVLFNLSDGARRQRIISSADYKRVIETLNTGTTQGDTGPSNNIDLETSGGQPGSRVRAGSQGRGANTNQGVGNNRVRPRFNVNIVQGTAGRPNRTEAYRQQDIEPLSFDEILEEFPWITNPRESVRGAERRWKVRDPSSLRDRLGLDRRNRMQAVRGRPVHGRFLVRLEQLWNEVPVYSATVAAEQNDYGELYTDSLDGEFFAGIDEDLDDGTASYSETEALYTALNFIDHDRDEIENPQVKLFIYDSNGTAVLAYLVDWYAPESDYIGTGPLQRNQRQNFKRKIFSTAENEARTTTTTATSETNGRQRGSNRNYRAGQWSSFSSHRRSSNRVQLTSPFDEPTPASTRNRPQVSDYTFPNLHEILGSDPPTTALPNGEQRNDWTNSPVPSRPYVLLNALTKEVIFTYDGLAGATSRFKVKSLAVGNDKVGYSVIRSFVKKIGINCMHQSPMTTNLGGNKIEIIDAYQASSTSIPCSSLNDRSYDATNGAATPRNAALTAAAYTVQALRVISLADFPTLGDLRIEVHHQGYKALYTGLRILLGDGWDGHLYPQTTLDIVAHEIAHAFTAGPGMSNLAMSGDSGAINEAFADITAAAMLDRKNYNNPYLMGSRITVMRWRAIRDMCDPNVPDLLSYESSDPSPTHYTEYQVKPTVDFHRDSSMFSLLFCRLSKYPGWDIQETYKVFMSANTIFWSRNIGYPEAGCGLVKATRFEFNNLQSKIDDIKYELSRIGLGCENEVIPQE